MGLVLLGNASMALKYCDQAFLMATHLINRTSSKLLNYDTPLHRLLGSQPDYSNLHTFGCACWPNLRPYNTHKLQFRYTCCVFLGYNNLHKGYECLDVLAGRVYISRDAVFDENVFPFAALHSTAGAGDTSEVLLLPESSPSWASIDAPLNNYPDNPCLPHMPVWTNQQFQPQRIPETPSVQVPCAHSRCNSFTDPRQIAANPSTAVQGDPAAPTPDSAATNPSPAPRPPWAPVVIIHARCNLCQ
jgi:hypothetical protein